MRRALLIPVLAGSTAAAMAIVACVGDDPTSGPSPDSGIPETEAPLDTGSPDLDAGGDTGVDAPTAVNCHPLQPQLFSPVPATGPFCQGAPNNHCAVGEHCCRNIALNTFACAATCPDDVVDIECLNSAECHAADAGALCCAKGLVRLDVCSYAVVEGIQSTSCAASCSNEFQVCAASPDCNGKTCTPTRALTPDGKGTSTLQIGACL